MRNTHVSILQGKPRKKKLRRWRWVGWWCLLFLLLLGLWYVVFSTDLLRVQRVEVRDTALVEPARLISALSTELTDGTVRALLGADHILFWMFRGGEPRELTTVPLVAGVSLTPHLFARTVEVTVEERKLFGVWCAVDPSSSAHAPCYGFDREGILFSEVPEVSGNLILRVNDENRRTLVLGFPVFPRPIWMEHFLDTASVLSEQNLSVAEFTVKPFALREWRAKLASGTAVYFSLDFVPENLSAILESFKAKPDFEKLAYLDLRVPNRVYFR